MPDSTWTRYPDAIERAILQYWKKKIGDAVLSGLRERFAVSQCAHHRDAESPGGAGRSGTDTTTSAQDS